MKAGTSRLYETRKNKSGHTMTIIEYNSNKDVTVKFDTGFIKKHVRYSCFQTGTLKCPGDDSPDMIAAKKSRAASIVAKNREKHMNETIRANNGQIMTIIKYENNNDITVQFEDGTIIPGKKYAYFKKGAIANPNYTNHEHGRKVSDSVQKKMQEKRIGEISKATNGMTLKITEYRNYNDIDVMFVEDGYKVFHTAYDVFKTGQIKNPNLCAQNRKNEHLHERFMTNEGEEIEIIDWEKYSNVTVKFQDGSTKQTDYRSICNGNVAKPGNRVPIEDIKTRIGETSLANCGQTMIIIAAKSSTDIDVRFENGDIVKHTKYHDFKTGRIRIPNRIINGMKYSRTKTMLAGIPHWKCKCQKCGFEDYMTIEQMKQHNCQETMDFITNVAGTKE